MNNPTTNIEAAENNQARCLELSYSYFGAGPGLSGTSNLKINWRNDNVSVSFIADKTGDENEPDVFFTLPENTTWREIVKEIRLRQIFAFITDGDMSGDFAWPDRIRRSDTTIDTDIFIVWGWAGPPLSDIVESLSFINDSQGQEISSILNKLSSSHNSLEKIASYFYELDDPKAELKYLILRQKNKPLKISNLLKDRFKLMRIRALEEKTKKDLENWLIEPFKIEIDRIIEKWVISNPASGNSYAMGHSIRKGAIRSYISQYISQHGCLPKGKHSTDVNFSNAIIHVEFNIDDLM
jgi:hypothetical protein